MSTVAAACPTGPELSLAECLARLDEIAREMARDLDLEGAVDLYAEACAIHGRAEAILTRVQRRIEELGRDDPPAPTF